MLFRLYQPTASQTDTVEIDSADQASYFYPKQPGIRFNYVIRFGFPDSATSSTHSNPIDRMFLKAIRQNADLVITSGATARAEQLKGSASVPMLILTKQEKLVVPATTERSKFEVLITNNQENLGNPAAKSIGFVEATVPEYLKSLLREYPCIALEVGLGLASGIISANLVDEVCLTITGCASENAAWRTLNHFLEGIGFAGSPLLALNSGETWLFRISQPKS